MIPKNNYRLNWAEYFQYDEKSPSGLVWIKLLPNARSVKVGDIAGTKQYRKNGQPSKWIVKFGGINYAVSRIVYILNSGYVENDLIIDHIDRNPFNNNIRNLRVTTEGGNLKNKNYQKNNSSGFTGVSIIIKGATKYYCATWMDPETKKQRNKTFSVKSNGELLAKLKSVVFRYEKLKEVDLNQEYSDQHYNYLQDDISLLNLTIEKIERLKTLNEESNE